MRERVLSLTAGLAVVLVAVGCADSGTPESSTPRSLRSERRLRFLVAAPVPPDVAPLRDAVADEMRAFGLVATDDAQQFYNVEVRVASASDKAEMQVLAEGRLLDRLTAERGADGTRGLARALVIALSQSERVSGYADSLYGRRLRPLRETVGRRSHVPGDHGGTPPLESLGPAGRDGD